MYWRVSYEEHGRPKSQVICAESNKLAEFVFRRSVPNVTIKSSYPVNDYELDEICKNNEKIIFDNRNYGYYRHLGLT